LAGLWVPIAGSLAVTWFTDPPPFAEPFPTQGSPLAWAALAGLAGALLVAVYQFARGLRAVVGAAFTLAGGLAGWVLSADRAPPAPSQPLPAGAPNVLVVTLDTTRADRLGAYGNDRVDTRSFDRLALEGTLFEDAVAVAPVTGPSHASMFSGRHPADHGLLLNGTPLPEEPLLAEVLRDHGYDTAAFVSAYVLDGDLGFRRGFAVYDDDFGWLKGGGRLLPARLWAMARRHADPDEVLQRRGGDTVDAALAWLAQPRGAYFLWVHLFDAHGPYEPPPPYDTRYYSGDPHDPAHTSMTKVGEHPAYLKRSLEGVTDLAWVEAQYDGEVSYADAQLGRLLDAIDPQNTLVVVLADHGESLGEHGTWFEHVGVEEVEARIPWVMRWPGRVPAGRRSAALVEGSDLAPTVLDLVRIPIPHTMTGHPALKDPPRTAGRSLALDRAANRAARARGEIDEPRYRVAGLRGPGTRYVLHEAGDAARFYDLAGDPLGLVDVAGTFPPDSAGAELLRHLHGDARALFGGDTVRQDLSDEERERLESLGYLDD
ncbi:MAG: sulfatase, partial [Myxococcota bacterium]